MRKCWVKDVKYTWICTFIWYSYFLLSLFNQKAPSALYRHIFFMFLKHIEFTLAPFPPPTMLLGYSSYPECLKNFHSFYKLRHLFRVSLSCLLPIWCFWDYFSPQWFLFLWHFMAQIICFDQVSTSIRVFISICLNQISLGKEPGISLGLITNRA